MSGEFCERKDAQGARCLLAHGHRELGITECQFQSMFETKNGTQVSVTLVDWSQPRHTRECWKALEDPGATCICRDWSRQ